MVKNKNFDSEFCGSLPLHHINVVQSYGYLLIVNKADLNILQVSENVANLFNTDLPQIIGQSISKFTDTENLQELLRSYNGLSKEKIPATLTINNEKLPALLHLKEAYLILEIENRAAASERSFVNVFGEVRYAIAAIEHATSVEEVSRVAISELRKVTGFDGVMMYRFDNEWNGTVIAEDKVDDELEHYMGHTFPASDVPKQARELYLKNPYRLIPDREYQPVRLYPVINPVTQSFIDLSDCNLRGVAAVHLEYLKNMNVQASMSIRVVYQGQLWGLIACHHLTPHYLSFELCAVCELLSSVISNKITSILYKERFEEETKLQREQTDLIAQVYSKNDLIDGLFPTEGKGLANLFDSTGVVAILNGTTYTNGVVPDKDFIGDMVLWLQSKVVKTVYATDHLPQVYEDAASVAGVASGVLVLPVDFAKGDFVICFRPEVVKEIKWGGNPNQAINFEADGKNYHPRNSFKIWQEQVHHTSNAWTPQEMRVADVLRSFIYEFKTKQALV
ncbi:GAF domain-containing protein [Mucilaginibacter pallidiroseus]|uniref:GAF domain-containing protein n=1 Tax=Mucilaginibacter pallidiroseus TaxID=2599295 RepID=A0A563UJK3_9SPHI|nr:GAF domain-containing protein [Mucilaginibacter pallidiroseus]TWR31547.1 GAF domain-containing protein [Mucilaginibacter pallidiroseus]